MVTAVGHEVTREQKKSERIDSASKCFSFVEREVLSLAYCGVI